VAETNMSTISRRCSVTVTFTCHRPDFILRCSV